MYTTVISPCKGAVGNVPFVLPHKKKWFLSSLFVVFSTKMIPCKKVFLLLYLLTAQCVGSFGRSFSCKSKSVFASNSGISFEVPLLGLVYLGWFRIFGWL